MHYRSCHDRRSLEIFSGSSANKLLKHGLLKSKIPLGFLAIQSYSRFQLILTIITLTRKLAMDQTLAAK